MALAESERIISLLKNAIRLSNYTYRDVERQLGWRVGTITRLLRGGLGLKIEYLLCILSVVKLSPARFFAAAYPAASSTAAGTAEDRLFRLLEQLHGGPEASHAGAPLAFAPAPAPGFDSAAGVGRANAAGAAAQADIDEMVQVSLRKLIGAAPPASGSSGGSDGSVGGSGTAGARRDSEP